MTKQVDFHYINGRDNIKNNYRKLPDTNIRFCDLDASQKIGIFMMLSRFFEKNYILAIVSKHLSNKQYNYFLDTLTHILINSLALSDISASNENVFNSSNLFKSIDNQLLSEIFTREKRFAIFIEIIEYEMNACGIRRSLKHRETILNMCKKILTTPSSEHMSFFDLYMRLGSICFSGMFHNIYDFAHNGPITEQAIDEYKEFFASFNVPLEKTRFIADRQTYTKADLAFLQSKNISYIIAIEHKDIFDKFNQISTNSEMTGFTKFSSTHAQRDFNCTLDDYLESDKIKPAYFEFISPNSRYKTLENKANPGIELKNKYHLSEDLLKSQLKVICITKLTSLDKQLYQQAFKAYKQFIVQKRQYKSKSQYAKFLELTQNSKQPVVLSDTAIEILDASTFATTYLITNDTTVSTDSFTESWSRRNFFIHNFMTAQKDVEFSSKNLSAEIKFIVSNILAVVHAILNVSINSVNADSEIEQFRLTQLENGLNSELVIKRINSIYMYFKNKNILFHPNINQLNLLHLLDIDYIKILPLIIETEGFKAIALDHNKLKNHKTQTLESKNSKLILKK